MDLTGSLDLQGRVWGCSLYPEKCPSMDALAGDPGLVFLRQLEQASPSFKTWKAAVGMESS